MGQTVNLSCSALAEFDSLTWDWMDRTDLEGDKTKMLLRLRLLLSIT